jgi:hypothetical protein
MSPVSADQSLEVVTSLDGGSDPMPVHGARVVYGGLGNAVGRSVAAAATSWAERHRAERDGGWQILVEIVRSDARVHDGRLAVEIETRVTVRGVLRQIHLGQTRGYCKVSDPLADSDGSSVVYRCLDRMARDLAGWLEGINA